MRNRRPLLLTATHLGAIALGALVAWQFGARLQFCRGMLGHIGAVGFYSLQLDLLRREGHADAYRDALIANLAFLEELQYEPDPFLTKAALQGDDEVLTLARLARLESGRGRDTESKAYVERAVQNCREVPWRDCDAERILRLSEQLEKRTQDGNTTADAAGAS